MAALRAVRRWHDHRLGRAPRRQRALGHEHRIHRASRDLGHRRVPHARPVGRSRQVPDPRRLRDLYAIIGYIEIVREDVEKNTLI